MAIDIYQVDAFTEKPFGGNPAAVCILPGPADPAWMQKVARDMNVSETAFLYGENSGLQSALVHAYGRGGDLRPRDPCKRAYTVGGGARRP